MVAGSQGFDLGNAHGKIILDASGVQRGIEQAQQSMDRGIRQMGRSITRMGDQVSRFGASLTLATTPILAFGVSGVRAAARFEDALVEVQARAGLTEEQLEAVRVKALEIGRDTAFSAGQGAEAFLQLITSGQSVEEAMTTIGAVMEGAAAAGTDLGFTADALTDIMAQFSSQGVNAAEVVNALTKASGSSSATFEDLAQGFQNGGAEAAGFGISIAETAAILATFSENGIKGAEAGTKLKSMLKGMTSQTSDTVETWTRLGISMFDATGTARPLGDVMLDLRGALSGMTQEAQIDTIQSLAGSYGSAGLRALVFGESLEDMTAKMREAATASEVADARMSTFSGSIKFLKGSIETFQIQVLTPLMENVLKPIVLAFSGIVNKATAWAAANPKLTATITKVALAVVALGPALFIVGKAISVIGGLITLAFSPLGVLIIGITALVAAYETNFLGLRDLVDGVFGVISRAVERFMIVLGEDGLVAAFGSLFAIFEDGSSALSSFFRALGIGQQQARAMADAVNLAFQRFFTVLGEDGIIGAVRSLFIVFEDGNSSISAFLEALGLSETLSRAVAGAFNIIALFVFDTLIPALQAMAVWFLEEGLPAIVSFVTETVIPAFGDFINLLVGIWETVRPALESLADWFLTSALPAVLAFVQDHIFPLIEEFIRLIGNIWEVGGPLLQQFAEWFLETAMPAIIAFLDGPVTFAFNGIVTIITTIVDALTDGLAIINDFIESGRNIADVIPNLNPLDALSSLDPRKLLRGGNGLLLTEPTPIIAGDNVQSGSFEAVLQEPQLRALLAEVKGSGGGGDIIINAEPGTLNIAQDPATQGTILAEQLDRKLRELGVR